MNNIKYIDIEMTNVLLKKFKFENIQSDETISQSILPKCQTKSIVDRRRMNGIWPIV